MSVGSAQRRRRSDPQRRERIAAAATSVKEETVTASLILSKLASYPRRDGLAWALKEIGKIERTLFALKWMKSPSLRRRVTAGLNKGEARKALARAVFFNRLGEMRDCSYEDQLHRASGLNLICAAISLWNTTYIDAAVRELRGQGIHITDEHLSHLSLAWDGSTYPSPVSADGTSTRQRPATFDNYTAFDGQGLSNVT